MIIVAPNNKEYHYGNLEHLFVTDNGDLLLLESNNNVTTLYSYGDLDKAISVMLDMKTVCKHYEDYVLYIIPNKDDVKCIWCSPEIHPDPCPYDNRRFSVDVIGVLDNGEVKTVYYDYGHGGSWSNPKVKMWRYK